MRGFFSLLAAFTLVACGDAVTSNAFDDHPESTKAVDSGTSLGRPVTVDVALPPSVDGARFSPLTPVRLLDSRDGTGLAPGKFKEPLVAGAERVIDLSGLESLFGPLSMRVGFALNITVTDTQGAGFLRVLPCGSKTDVVALTFDAAETIGGMVIAPGVDKICVTSSVGANIVIDALGVFQKGMGSLFHASVPRRIYDSRTLEKSTQFAIPVPGLPAQTEGVAVHLTITEPEGPGFARVYPCGTAPDTLTLTFVAGETIATTALSLLGTSGAICVASSVNAHVVLDIEGAFGGGDLQFLPEPPSRIFDSRSGAPTTTYKFVATGAPSSAKMAAFYLTAMGATTTASAVVHACDKPDLKTSTVNIAPGKMRTSFTLAPLSAAGEVCVTTSSPLHVVADMVGVLAP